MRNVDVWVNVLRDGVKHTTLTPVEAPNLIMNGAASIKSSLTGKYIFNADVDWGMDSLQPIIRINGEEHTAGVFLPATYTISETSDGKTIRVEAYDQCWLCEATISTTVVQIQSGINYISAVEELLAACGIEHILAIPTEYTIASARADWDLGTDYLTIINQLLDEINYNPLWFNADGFAVLEPEDLADVNNLKRTYDFMHSRGMMLTSMTSKTDFYRAPNKILVICSNSDFDTVLTATAENRSDFSPISIPRRGKTIMSVRRVDNIASQTALDDYATLIVQEEMMKGETLAVSTPIRTDCGLNDVVAIVHPDISGLCVETGWSMELCAGGSMEHNLAKVVSFS